MYGAVVVPLLIVKQQLLLLRGCRLIHREEVITDCDMDHQLSSESASLRHKGLFLGLEDRRREIFVHHPLVVFVI